MKQIAWLKTIPKQQYTTQKLNFPQVRQLDRVRRLDTRAYQAQMMMTVRRDKIFRTCVQHENSQG